VHRQVAHHGHGPARKGELEQRGLGDVLGLSGPATGTQCTRAGKRIRRSVLAGAAAAANQSAEQRKKGSALLRWLAR
jgi:hypothetical protein